MAESGEKSGEEEEYIVEAIRGWRYNLADKRKEFCIKWLGYPDEQNTWEPLENLTHCPDIMNEFVKSLSPDDYFHRENLEKLTGFQRNAEFVRYVGVDGPHDSDDEGSSKVKKHCLYVLAQFDDSDDLIEEITLEEFLQYRPEDALRFCEERLLYNEPRAHCKNYRQQQQHKQ